VRADELPALLDRLTRLPQETEWVEFKHNYSEPQEIGEYLSALSNSAALHGKEAAFLVWGVEDASHKLVGTTFRPRSEKKGKEELEGWLARQLDPSINFKIYEFVAQGKPVVIFEIPPATHTPVRFADTGFIRVGTYRKKLRDFPEKERELWALLSRVPFEKGTAKSGLNGQEVTKLLDYSSYFALVGRSEPGQVPAILDALGAEKLVLYDGMSYQITNLGAILFANRLDVFELSRKAVRAVIYAGDNRVETTQELAGNKGYASGFSALVRFINSRLPENEHVGQALRKKVPMYPEIAIRELVANALVHQDFSLTGTGPLIEIFSDRIEITNPGVPLIDTQRFLDAPPQSRNDALAAFMRRVGICEERGSGIDKVVAAVELFQLPAPDFTVTERHTRAALFAHKKLAEMTRKDRIRACYQHASLMYVSNKPMTNASLRARFSIADQNYAVASRIIAETIDAKLVKPADPASKSRKHARYVPFWA
jgi:ATP-dependent DNA helicase RecG